MNISTIMKLISTIFIAGIVDAIEVADRWEEFKIENVAGQPPGKGSKYRNVVVAMACVMLWGTPDPSWKEGSRDNQPTGSRDHPQESIASQV